MTVNLEKDFAIFCVPGGYGTDVEECHAFHALFNRRSDRFRSAAAAAAAAVVVAVAVAVVACFTRGNH
jgi:hypothetical protein